jgi:hypothetical protein
MLIPVTYLKDRLGITSQSDVIALTRTIEAVGVMFDRYADRHFERSDSAEQFFRADAREIPLLWYPVEVVSAIYVRDNARSSWTRQTPDYELRHNCILSLSESLGGESQQGRILYSGGYVAAGTTAESWQTALPKDIELAAIDQAAFWYENKHGLRVPSAASGAKAERSGSDLNLLPHVRTILDTYRRIAL